MSYFHIILRQPNKARHRKTEATMNKKTILIVMWTKPVAHWIACELSGVLNTVLEHNYAFANTTAETCVPDLVLEE